ncbi:glutamate--tRNA ligase [bacterium]|nr:glutamate--tRNA ligase [bacterium]
MKVVTRFAPSPTGYLHLGSARTAIYNYLYAKKNKGKYLIRIEDTDKKRSTQAAIEAIHDGLNWLQINSSEKIVYQSQQIVSHVKVAFDLLKKGYAYKCYLSSEELNKLRMKSRKRGIPIRSPWRNKINNKENKNFVLRLKMPETGLTTINDLVQGKVSVNNNILDDMIILRSDKTPTYMLSSVVDDFNMGVTHIIRGDDHLNNAFRQIQIIKFMKWKLPIYAHIPLIHGNDGTKLSKRHGATNVYDYHKMGYTHEAIFTYLLQISSKNNNEIFMDLNQIINSFSIDRINKGPARFDLKKLNNINSKYLRNMNSDKIYKLIVDFFDLDLDQSKKERFMSFLPELLKRVDVFIDIKNDIDWIVNDDFICVDKQNKFILKQNQSILKEIASLLSNCKWTKIDIEKCINQFVVDKPIKFKDIGPILRLALTGKKNSPDLITIIYELGCVISLNRLNYDY